MPILRLSQQALEDGCGAVGLEGGRKMREEDAGELQPLTALHRFKRARALMLCDSGCA